MYGSLVLLGLAAGVTGQGAFEPMVHQDPMLDRWKYADACPDYRHYSANAHPPWSKGPLELSFQRPAKYCRTFKSPLVEKIIKDVTSRMADKDLARLFENTFPNTLDTTVRWHVNGTEKHLPKPPDRGETNEGQWAGPQSFVVTGDINAEWLRDSTNQLAPYMSLARKDKAIFNLILGAINTQAEFIIESPYCNAFQPPLHCGIPPTSNGQGDTVHPMYDPSSVFECKWELDSLAAFLKLTNDFYDSTGNTDFFTPRWDKALRTVLVVLDEQSKGTFDPEDGHWEQNEYTFQRRTNTGTETLSLGGIGNPLNSRTGLIRSAFRPSDDATILGFLIPANAMMSVELRRLSKLLEKDGKFTKYADIALARSKVIEKGIYEHAVVDHKVYGKVFAYEVDGYGSHILMDDANLPSLLSLPLLGFVAQDDKVYQNTRRMILSKAGNPYYLTGLYFQGIGGPHIGLQNAWPMALISQMLTTDNVTEIDELLGSIKNVSSLGLIHETEHVDYPRQYTRSWFSWANSYFASAILSLAKRKPHLLFGGGGEAYDIDAVEV